MSMLSAQCDELRSMAESVGLAMPQAATLMMEAADAILELRDDLQQANYAVRDAEHDESMAWDRVRKAESENAKLRELATGLYKCWLNEGCESCPMQDDDGWCVRDIRLRELGIEVE